MPPLPPAPFDWRDGDRLVLFGRGRAAEAAERLGDGYALVTTERAARSAPALAERAGAVVQVGAGRVDELAAGLADKVRAEAVGALGGGRVIDVAKAIVAARGSGWVAAVPTTLSSAEMTALHRTIPGTRGSVRPRLVVNDPALSASQPDNELAASSLNALGHAVEAPMTVRANLVATLVAHEGARRIAAGWRDLDAGLTLAHLDNLALGALLAGYAIDSTGYGLHHVLSQTLARHGGVAHGAANAVMLPHSLRALARRRPHEVEALGVAIGEDAISFATALGSRAGATRLRELGVAAEDLADVADHAAARPQLADTPPPADRSEVLALYETAW